MNAEDWNTLAIPGEYDAMDDCDKGRWRGVIEQAFALGRVRGMTEAAWICIRWDGTGDQIAEYLAAAIEQARDK